MQFTFIYNKPLVIHLYISSLSVYAVPLWLDTPLTSRSLLPLLNGRTDFACIDAFLASFSDTAQVPHRADGKLL